MFLAPLSRITQQIRILSWSVQETSSCHSLHFWAACYKQNFYCFWQLGSIYHLAKKKKWRSSAFENSLWCWINEENYVKSLITAYYCKAFTNCHVTWALFRKVPPDGKLLAVSSGIKASSAADAWREALHLKAQICTSVTPRNAQGIELDQFIHSSHSSGSPSPLSCSLF